MLECSGIAHDLSLIRFLIVIQGEVEISTQKGENYVCTLSFKIRELDGIVRNRFLRVELSPPKLLGVEFPITPQDTIIFGPDGLVFWVHPTATAPPLQIDHGYVEEVLA